MANKAMPAHHRCKRLESEIRSPRPVQVIDEPAYPGNALHPFKKMQNLKIFKMMSKERADDQINRFGFNVKRIRIA